MSQQKNTNEQLEEILLQSALKQENCVKMSNLCVFGWWTDIRKISSKTINLSADLITETS